MLYLGSTVTSDSGLSDTIQSIIQDVYQFVSKIQKPKLNDQAWRQAVQTRSDELSNKVTLALKNLSERQKSLSVSLENMSLSLQNYVKELEGSPNAIRMRQNFRSLSIAYEDLVLQSRRMKKKSLGKGDRYAHIKPVNYARNIFHVFMGAVGFVSYQYFLTYNQAMGVLIVFLAVVASLEIARRISPAFNRLLMDQLFKSITRPKERNHVNSATYYLIAITLITAACPKPAALLGLLVLALADPAATLVGKKWGLKKLWKEKSYVGTIAFFGTAVAASMTYLVFSNFSMTWLQRVSLCLSVATVGTLAELFSEVLDDNFTIPILAAGVASLWF